MYCDLELNATVRLVRYLLNTTSTKLRRARIYGLDS